MIGSPPWVVGVQINMTKRKAESSPEVVFALGESYSEVAPSTGTAQAGLAVEAPGPTGLACTEGTSAGQAIPTVATLDGTEDLADTT